MILYTSLFAVMWRNYQLQLTFLNQLPAAQWRLVELQLLCVIDGNPATDVQPFNHTSPLCMKSESHGVRQLDCVAAKTNENHQTFYILRT